MWNNNANVLYAAQKKSGYEAQAYIPSTQHEVAVWRCTQYLKKKKPPSLHEPGELLGKETPRFSLFPKKKRIHVPARTQALLANQTPPKSSSPESPPPPPNRTIHTTYCNQPQATKTATKQQASPPPPRRAEKQVQDAPNATVCSMKTSSIYSVEPRFETAAVTRKIFLSLSESLVVCVSTFMLLERFRSWSCVYRMGREGGGDVEEGS